MEQPSGCLQRLTFQLQQFPVVTFDIIKSVGQREKKPGLAVVEQRVVGGRGQVDVIQNNGAALQMNPPSPEGGTDDKAARLSAVCKLIFFT